MDNPFKFGRVVDDQSFCNRKKEIAELKKYIRDSHSVWLYSPRRYGKTSLVKKVFNELSEVKTIYFDLYNVNTVDDFCKKYAKLIATVLFDWKLNLKTLASNLTDQFKGLKPSIVFDESGSPTFSLQAEKIETQLDVETVLNIPNTISKKNKIKICIAFDEFQEISRIEPFLINWMRSAFQLHENISYVFLGSKQSLMQTIFSSYNSPFYEFGLKMEINPIARDELFNFVNEKFKSCNLKINPEAINQMLDISECHPHFTQYFASEMFYLLLSGEGVTEEGFTGKWLSKVIQSQSHIFQNIFDQLSNIQRSVLIALVEIQPNEGLFSSEVRSKYKLPVSSTLNTTLQGLIKKDLIRNNDSAYQIINPVFKQWLISIIKN